MNPSIITDIPTSITGVDAGGKLNIEQRFKSGLFATGDKIKQDRIKETAPTPAPLSSSCTAHCQDLLTTLRDQHHQLQHNLTNALETKSWPSSLSQTLLDRRVLLRMTAEKGLAISGSCHEVEDLRDQDFEYLNEIEDTTTNLRFRSSSPAQSSEKVDILQFDLYLLSSLNQKMAEIEAGNYHDEDDGDSFNSGMTEDSIDIAKRRLLRCKSGRKGRDVD